jgi:hypothetical protein
MRERSSAHLAFIHAPFLPLLTWHFARFCADILGDGTTATPWDLALGPTSDRDALCVASHHIA